MWSGLFTNFNHEVNDCAVLNNLFFSVIVDAGNVFNFGLPVCESVDLTTYCNITVFAVGCVMPCTLYL